MNTNINIIRSIDTDNKFSKNIFVLFTIILLFIFLLLPQKVYADKGGYTTTSFHSDIQVRENHCYDVTETIQVHFSEPRHGIYRYIPSTGTFYRQINGRKDEKEYHAYVERKPVSGSSAIKTESWQDGDEFVIRMGDRHHLVTGDQTYVLHYTWNPGDDEITDFDDFYFNVIPHNWPTTINRASFTIMMPKKFDQNKLHAYTGKYGQTTANNLKLKTEGHIINGNIQNLAAKEGVTVNLKLPEGYYKNEWSLQQYALKVIIAALICLTIGVIIYFFLGRNHKPVVPIMFYAPHDFDPLQISTIYHNGQVENKAIPAMIIYLANEGFIKIKQVDRQHKKSYFKFYKLKELPKNSKNYNKLIFQTLFKKRINREGDKNVYTDTICTSSQAAQDIAKKVPKVKKMAKSYFSRDEKILTTGSKVAFWLYKLLSAIIIIISIVIIFWLLPSNILNTDSFFWISSFLLIIFIFQLFPYGKFINALKEQRLGLKRKKKLRLIGWGIASVYGTLFTIIPSITCFNNAFVLLICACSIFLLMILGRFTARRTPQANKWYGEIIGFQKFLQMAEKPRIEKLVEENPNYFFDILPYAYVLDVTDKWVKHFEGMIVEQPDWYSNSIDDNIFNIIYFTNAINDTLNRMNRAITSTANNNRSDYFNSDFSGGGFSGGGGGGGGGGSW